MVLACRDQGILPAIIFCAARRECEALARHLVQHMQVQLLSAQEAEDVEQAFADMWRTCSGHAYAYVVCMQCMCSACAVVQLCSACAVHALCTCSECALHVHRICTAYAQRGQVFESAVRTLSEEDRALPQVCALLPLLKGGVGLHHSGLLPLLREVLELL